MRRDGQRLVFGAVFFPLDANLGEVGVELVGLDAYHPEATARLVELVADALDVPEGTRVLYMPVAEQQGCAAQQAGWLAARGVELAALDRWIAGNACYARGWGVGRLTKLPAGIEDAFIEGRLRHTDICSRRGPPS